MFWWGPKVGYDNKNRLRIRYGYDDDLYEGDDWEFIYAFDRQNSQRFIEAIRTGEDPGTLAEYIESHFDSRSILEEFCKKNGIHGESTHIGEYPPTFFGPYEF